MKKILASLGLALCCTLTNAIELFPQKSTYYYGGHIKTWYLDKFALDFTLETVDTPNIKDAYIIPTRRNHHQRSQKHQRPIPIHGQKFLARDGFKLKSAIYTDGDVFTLFLKERSNQPTLAFISMIAPDGYQFYGLDFEIEDTFSNLKVQEMGWSAGIRITGKSPNSTGETTNIEFKKGNITFSGVRYKLSEVD